MRDKRTYVVKYQAENSKSRQVNVTDFNVIISDLKPNTLYEFMVKLVKGKLLYLLILYFPTLIFHHVCRSKRKPMEYGCNK